jgi:hypothetical protein
LNSTPAKVSDAFVYAANCHCSEYRAATGSAFEAFAGIEREKLTITEGLDDVTVFGEEDLNATRCGACGSFLSEFVSGQLLRRLTVPRAAAAKLTDCPSQTYSQSEAKGGPPMPWVQVQKAEQATWSDYERVQNAVGEEAPEGLIYHAAGEQDDGRWQAVSIWESEEHFNRFRDERLLPAVRDSLGDQMAEGGPPPTESFATKHVLKP